MSENSYKPYLEERGYEGRFADLPERAVHLGALASAEIIEGVNSLHDLMFVRDEFDQIIPPREWPMSDIFSFVEEVEHVFLKRGALETEDLSGKEFDQRLLLNTLEEVCEVLRKKAIREPLIRRNYPNEEVYLREITLRKESIGAYEIARRMSAELLIELAHDTGGRLIRESVDGRVSIEEVAEARVVILEAQSKIEEYLRAVDEIDRRALNTDRDDSIEHSLLGYRMRSTDLAFLSLQLENIEAPSAEFTKKYKDLLTRQLFDLRKYVQEHGNVATGDVYELFVSCVERRRQIAQGTHGTATVRIASLRENKPFDLHAPNDLPRLAHDVVTTVHADGKADETYRYQIKAQPYEDWRKKRTAEHRENNPHYHEGIHVVDLSKGPAVSIGTILRAIPVLASSVNSTVASSSRVYQPLKPADIPR